MISLRNDSNSLRGSAAWGSPSCALRLAGRRAQRERRGENESERQAAELVHGEGGGEAEVDGDGDGDCDGCGESVRRLAERRAVRREEGLEAVVVEGLAEGEGEANVSSLACGGKLGLGSPLAAPRCV